MPDTEKDTTWFTYIISRIVTGTAALRAEVEEIKGKTADLHSFMKIVDRCADITELTADVARTFVDRVIVHEAVYDTIPHQQQRSPKSRSQEVHIFLNFIGEFSPN